MHKKYIAGNRLPTNRNYDYLNATVAAQTIINLSDLQEALYEIGIYGYSGGHFSLLVTVFSDAAHSCINDCSSHGSCSSLVCSCYDGYSGDYCQTCKIFFFKPPNRIVF